MLYVLFRNLDSFHVNPQSSFHTAGGRRKRARITHGPVPEAVQSLPLVFPWPKSFPVV